MVRKYTLSLFLLSLLSAGVLSQEGHAQEIVAPAETIHISGTVTDKATGKAIGYATVAVANSSIGTNTDESGFFELDVPAGSVLDISLVGYASQSVTAAGAGTINISLQADQTALDQVVVVGYGTQKRKDLSTAVSSIKGAELSKQPVLTATQALQGKAAGVQIIGSGDPGEQPRMIVRGIGTMSSDDGSNGTTNILKSGGSNALYVVDGVLTNNITNINTADIESIDILKDASATAIYGSRGANGVIIITTKKGSIGTPLQVSYNGSVGVKSIANRVKMANAEEYANYYQAATGKVPNAGQGEANTDWYNEVLRSAIQQNHNVSVFGGGEKSTYYLTLGYMNDKGIIQETDFKRYTLRLNNEFRFTDAIRAGTEFKFANANSREIELASVYQNAYRAAPIVPAMQGDKYGNTSNWGNVGNPLLDIYGSNHRVVSNRLQGNAYIQARIIDGLTFRSSISADYMTYTDRNYGYQFFNDEETFIIAGGNQIRRQSELTVTQGDYLHWVWDNTLTYTKTISDHTFTVLGGITSEQRKYSDLYGKRKNVPSDPSLWFLGQGDPNTAENEGRGVDFFRRASYFGRLNYAYKDRYLLAATLRYDGSSRLPVQNRWQTYPSVSGAWVISKEGFMKSQSLFSNLKLRAGYGEVGNDQIPSNAYIVSLTNSSYPFGAGTATTGKQIQQVEYRDLNWERTKEFSTGVDFTLLKDRLSGEINYYDKKVDNALVNIRVPATTGDKDNLIFQNIGQIQNKGWEFGLNWNDQINDDWSYRIGGNISFNRNKVISLNGGQAIQEGFNTMGYITQTDNGQAIGSYYVYEVLGVFQDQAEISNYRSSNGSVIQSTANPGDFKYRDVNDDGIIDDRDRVYAGSYQPKAFFGLSLGTSYKAFDFSIDFYGNYGNQIYNGKKANRVDGTDNIEQSVAYGRWTPGSGINDEPAANAGRLPNSTYFIESGSFVRINNITLGYTLPQSVCEKVKLAGLRVYATAQNLYTWKKYSGFTPELPGTSPLNAGIEQSAFPTSRVVAVGLNVNFK